MENKEIILSILKEIKNGTTPFHRSYNLTLDMWAEFIEYLDDLKYITDVTIYWFRDDEYYDERVHSVDPKQSQINTFRREFFS